MRRARVERGVILVVQEVVKIRACQKRIGVRKLYHMLENFLTGARDRDGPRAFFDLLRENSLLVRRRRARKKPRTTFASPGETVSEPDPRACADGKRTKYG